MKLQGNLDPLLNFREVNRMGWSHISFHSFFYAKGIVKDFGVKEPWIDAWFFLRYSDNDKHGSEDDHEYRTWEDVYIIQKHV